CSWCWNLHGSFIGFVEESNKAKTLEVKTIRRNPSNPGVKKLMLMGALATLTMSNVLSELGKQPGFWRPCVSPI
ncbi:hypothetical protein, partial [Microcoleus sp. herbarium5]|uniref:hypothetical protein n=1 Tax=Microcoleus sp. herbarium5 TaxID=3055434 RepID=UPI002FD1F992